MNLIKQQVTPAEMQQRIKHELRMKQLKPKVLRWCFEAWKNMSGNLSAVQHGWHKCVSSLYDPFSLASQENVQKEIWAGLHLDISTYFDKDDENKVDHYVEEDSDDEKDELDLMKPRRDGERKSTRSKQQPEYIMNWCRINPLQIEEEGYESPTETAKQTKQERKRKQNDEKQEERKTQSKKRKQKHSKKK